MAIKLQLFFSFFFCYQGVTYGSLPPSCPSKIYCQGELLHDVQMSKLYPDSKTFVDLQLRTAPKEILLAYNDLKQQKGGNLSTNEIKEFVDQYFQEGDELEVWSPPDWKSRPLLSRRVENSDMQKWIVQLNAIWKTLGRKIKDDVKYNPKHYSLIYVPNGFIIPGGRFRELYYWDTYWIVKGLMLCDMHKTAKGVIENLLHLVKVLGHMPNGNRVYYWQRSQPPLLTQMVDYYVSQSDNNDFIWKAYPILKKEMDWWLKKRSVEFVCKNRTHLLFRYDAPSQGPRPESYREDFETASFCSDDDCKTNKYISLKSGAESGWDFSSRWFIKNASNEGSLNDIDTINIIPVDLNAIIHRNLRILRDYALVIGDNKDYYTYDVLAKRIQKSIRKVFFKRKLGIWLDYDLKNNKSRDYFYLSNFAPLWTKSYEPKYKTEISQNLLKTVQKINFNRFPGGIPTSLRQTGQQWDSPNAWPPLQAMLIYGLDELGTLEMKELAFKLAQTWVRSNYEAFVNTSHMFEKYNSTVFGGAGGGGEYDVQTGFGWTNGVILELLNTWPLMTPS